MGASLFRRTSLAVLVSLGLGAAAMLRYPGGTALDPASRGYSMSQNFLSDLGMTVAYDGRPNTIGALLFVLSLGVLVVGLAAALVHFLRQYAVTRTSRRLAFAAGATGALACAAFVGVAFTPEDRAMSLHVQFTLLAFRVLPLVALLLAFAARASDAPRPVVLVWLATTAALAAYAALLQWGPGLESPPGLTVYVVAQKAISVFLVAAVVYQAHVAARGVERRAPVLVVPSA